MPIIGVLMLKQAAVGLGIVYVLKAVSLLIQ